MSKLSEEDLTDVSPETAQEAFKDFTVTCKCGSNKVHWVNWIGYSAVSGGWGYAGFLCGECETETVMVEG